MAVETRVLTENALTDVIGELAALRITVFRDWPYLYEGDRAYEERYLAPYLTTKEAVVIGTFDGGRLVGASTGIPLKAHDNEFAAAFARTEIDTDRVFYCAESLLLPQYRGQGIGHRYFDLREAAARAQGLSLSAFCAVVRPQNHPQRPTTCRPLDGFWRARGYAPLEDVVARFSWKDIGDVDETWKRLQFWVRTL